MAGRIIYYGECNQPEHRVFIEAHLLPLIEEVIGRGLPDLEVLFLDRKSVV